MANETLFRGLSIRIVAFAIAILVLSLAGLSYATYDVFDRQAAAELDRKAAAVADLIANRVGRALDLGVPFDQLVGVEEFLGDVIQDQPEFASVALADAAGREVYRKDRPRRQGDVRVQSWPVTARGAAAGAVLIGVDSAALNERLVGIAFDVGVTLLVSALISLEVLLVLIAVSLTIPVGTLVTLMNRVAGGDFSRRVDDRARDQVGRLTAAFNSAIERVNREYRAALDRALSAGADAAAWGAELSRRFVFAPAAGAEPFAPQSVLFIRLPLFLFFFGSELPRSFLPILAKELHAASGPTPAWLAAVPGGDWLAQAYAAIPAEVLVALPLSAYLLGIALFSPVAGRLAAARGSRTLFSIGVVPAVAGYVLTFLADSLPELILWRTVNALGFAFVSIAALDHISAVTTPTTRAQGMAAYLAAYVSAGVCGTAIGAILADRIGFPPVFLLSAVFTLGSAVLLWILTPATPHRDAAPARKAGGGSMLRLLATPRFLGLLLCAGIPMQVIQSGFLFYYAPLLLQELGNRQAVIGRVLMIYFLLVIVFNEVLARWADGGQRHGKAVVIGLGLSGCAAAAVGLWTDTWAAAGSVAAIGVAWAFSFSAQGALLLRMGEGRLAGVPPAVAIGFYRLAERCGAMVAPVLMSLMITHMGFADTALITGVGIAICAVLFALQMAALPVTDSTVPETSR
ncbi:MAG TPA: MFS transporter [Azospirillum sp.]|nr:MFS transporter [Azospirillum sp.]